MATLTTKETGRRKRKINKKKKTNKQKQKKKKKKKTAVVCLKANYEGILFYEILMDCVARKRMQKTTSYYLKWFPRYCDLNFYMLPH